MIKLTNIAKSLCVLASVSFAATYSWKIVDSIPHSVQHFTQGLFWSGSELYESTGLVGHSALYRMDRKGKVLDSTTIAAPHFGEGSVRIGDDWVVLTWRSGLGFVYDAKTLKKKSEFPLTSEGWGLTQQNGLLILSSGRAELLKLAPDSKQTVGSILVTNQGHPVEKLNELEAVGKLILANVWYSDSIAVIAPDGHVQAWLNLAPIAKAEHLHNKQADVLNGIAWDGKHLWVTGKQWHEIYALEVQELK